VYVKKQIAIGISIAVCLMATRLPAQATGSVDSQTGITSRAAQQQSAEPAEKNPHGKGGLKIHGHWVVEVKRSDGTLADRREFENSYVGGGFVGFVLGGAVADIDPAILFSSATNGAGSFCNGTQDNACVIFASATSGHGAADTQGFNDCPAIATGPGCYTGLTSTLTPSGGPYTSWVLAGNITAQGSGTFDTVGTSIGNCFPTVNTAPVTSINSAQCNTNAVAYATANNNNAATGPYYYNNNFTSSPVPGGAVSVTAGETLAFTVTITFQ
jgi:hypothetical protein